MVLEDIGGSWGTVISSIGGPLQDEAWQVEGGWEGGRMRSAWWREIVRIRDGVGRLRDGWFGECVARKVGYTFF
jgi:hypothetical protein